MIFKSEVDKVPLKKATVDKVQYMSEKCKENPLNIHPHLLRHSRALHLYQHGMDLTLVSQWLGHSRLETTLIYAHDCTEQKKESH